MAKSQIYGDKLKGLKEGKIVGAIKYALRQCDAVGFTGSNMDSATYHSSFVPPFMAHLGLKDVKKVPFRTTLDLVYRGHLAKEKEETLNAQRETHNNSTDESDSESRKSDEDEESDGFVGSDSDDDDAAATTKVTAVVPCAPLRRLRNVPKPAAELLAEGLVPVRDALNQAKTALQKPSLGKNKTRTALRVIGLSGDGVLATGSQFGFEDMAYAIKQAERALPDEHGLDFSQMTTAREVWLALIQNHQGLGDGALEKRITATRERCAAASLERLEARPQATNQTSLSGPKASVVAGRKRRKMNEDADAEAIESLREDDFEDDFGAIPLPDSTFHRPVERNTVGDPTQYVWARDAETGQPVLIKAGEMQEKVIFGLDSKFQLGIGLNKDQDPIGEIVRDTAGDAVLMTGGAWNGHRLDEERFVSHRGREGKYALCIDFRDLALTWARGGHDDMAPARSALGLKLVSSTAVETTVGTLENFQHAHFESTGEIPGGLEGLMEDCEVLSAKMRAASAQATGPDVFLADGLRLQKLGSEGTVRWNMVGYSRCAGSMNARTKLKLDYLESEGLMALHHVSLKAALLGHVQVRLVAYAHAAAGNFHPDGSIVGPIRSSRSAASAAMAAPASLRSWNFSSGIGGAMPAHMGPAFG